MFWDFPSCRFGIWSLDVILNNSYWGNLQSLIFWWLVGFNHESLLFICSLGSILIPLQLFSGDHLLPRSFILCSTLEYPTAPLSSPLRCPSCTHLSLPFIFWFPLLPGFCLTPLSIRLPKPLDAILHSPCPPTLLLSQVSPPFPLHPRCHNFGPTNHLVPLGYHRLPPGLPSHPSLSQTSLFIDCTKNIVTLLLKDIHWLPGSME